MKIPTWPTSKETARASLIESQDGYTCPVCGFILSAPPQDFRICVSCGTEFGNDDIDWTHEQLRFAWMEDGFKWWSQTVPLPADWNPVAQVLKVIMLTGASNKGEIPGQENELVEVRSGIWASLRNVANSEVTCLA